jgi:hypothetical protein
VGQLMSSSNFNLIPQQTYSIPIADNVSGFLLFEMYDEYGKILSRGKTIIVK